jgi:hypothetical protein
LIEIIFDSRDGERLLPELADPARPFQSTALVDWKPLLPEEVQSALDYYANFVASSIRGLPSRYHF